MNRREKVKTALGLPFYQSSSDDEEHENLQNLLDERLPRLASELQSSDTPEPSRIESDTYRPASFMMNHFMGSNRLRRHHPYTHHPIELTPRYWENYIGGPSRSNIESPVVTLRNFRPGNFIPNPECSSQSAENTRDSRTEDPESSSILLSSIVEDLPIALTTQREDPGLSSLLFSPIVEDLPIALTTQRGDELNGMTTTGEAEEGEEVIVIDEIQHEEARAAASRPNAEEPLGDSVPKRKSFKLCKTNGNAQDNGTSTGRITNENDNNESTEKELNQDLLRLLECPVCMECMEPPLSQCRRGHLVCNSCRLQITFCPICRTTFSSTRNRAMEGVAELVWYPCRHECGKRMRLRRRASHEASCESRRYSCPMHQCTALQSPVPLQQLVQHIKSTHSASVKIGEEHKLLITTGCRKHEWMILALQELFHLRARIQNGHFDLYVAYVGPKCNSANYIYEVTAMGKCNVRKITYSRNTHSDQESCLQTLTRQDCFHLSVEQVVNLQRERGGQGTAPGMLDLRLRLAAA